MNKRILILADVAGTGPYYHIGDEATTEVAINRLKKSIGSNNLVLASPHPWTASQTYNIKTIALPMHTLKTWLMHLIFNPIGTTYRIIRVIWHLYRSEIVFKAGGGNIRGRNTKFPILSLARLLQKKIILVSQTIGPLDDLLRFTSQRQLEQAFWIGVRDRGFSGSQLGLPVHFAVDDAVFLSPKHNSTTSQLITAYPKMVGVSYSKFKNANQTELNSWYETTKEVIVSLDATPVFIPHHAPHGYGDLEIAQSIATTWGNDQSLIVIDVQPAQAVMALTGALQMVLASRYHAVIFGLAMGIPTIAFYHDLYTEAKMRGAFEQFGLEPTVLSLDKVADQLPRMAINVLAARHQFAVAAHSVQTTQLSRNMAPYELIRSLNH